MDNNLQNNPATEPVVASTPLEASEAAIVKAQPAAPISDEVSADVTQAVEVPVDVPQAVEAPASVQQPTDGQLYYDQQQQQQYTQQQYNQQQYNQQQYNQQQQYTPQPSGTTSPKDRTTAGILGILLGAFGAHKFYLGYTTPAVIMLVVSLVGSCLVVGPFVMGIIGLIEGIIYLTKSDAEFQNTYVTNKKFWF